MKTRAGSAGESGRLYKTINGGSDWYPVNTNVSVFLNYIVFTDQNTGIVTGNNKTILKTTDSGISWFSVNKNNALLDFHSAKILDKDNYIVTGTESSIYTSSNAGASWDTMSLGMPNPLLTVEFTDHNTGWVSGCCGMFLKTTNGGLNWSPEVYLTPDFQFIQ
ncbi:MAG: hypothetical protein IPL53_11120 [Ignavibacteria bacterium]|nr:hypothetical protein [Ignavibacteria bacterium]